MLQRTNCVGLVGKERETIESAGKCEQPKRSSGTLRGQKAGPFHDAGTNNLEKEIASICFP